MRKIQTSLKKILIFFVITLSIVQSTRAQDATSSAQVATDSASIQQSPTPTSTPSPTSFPFEFDTPPAATASPAPTFTQTPTPPLSPTLIPALDRLFMPSAQLRRAIILKPLPKKDYRADEAIITQVVVSPDTTFTSELIYADGSKENLQTERIENADFTTLRIEPTLEIKPGKYSLKVSDSSGFESSQEFTWAAVALNFDQSVYQTGQNAEITISLTDEKGTIVCDTNIDLTIRAPDSEKTFSTGDGSIVKNPACSPHTPNSATPDYQVSYQIPNSAGTYSILLDAKLPNATKSPNSPSQTYHLEDTFEVKESLPFLIKRQIPNRAFTPNWHNNILSITAQEDFSGEIREYIPESLDIGPSLEAAQQSYDKLEITSSLFNKGTILGTYIPPLQVPFVGTQSATLGFGENLKDPKLVRLYSQFGLAGHDGIDFDLPQGTPVVAADSGMVVLAGDGDYGTTIVLQHDWGRTYYGHLSQVNVVFGQRVTKGEIIGLSGNTGLSTGAHLHFSIKPNRPDMKNGYYGKINPLPYLAQVPGQVVLQEEPERVDSAPEDNSYARVKQLTWNVSLVKGQTIRLGYRIKLPQDSTSSYLLGPLSFIPSPPSNSPNPSLSPSFIENRLFQLLADPPPKPQGASFPQSDGQSFPMEPIDPKLLSVPPDYPFVKAALDQEIKGKYANLLLESASPSFQMSYATQSGQLNGFKLSFDIATKSAEFQRLTSEVASPPRWSLENSSVSPRGWISGKFTSEVLPSTTLLSNFSVNAAETSSSKTFVQSNRVSWADILPNVDYYYDTYDGYIDQKIILKNDTGQKDFALNLNLPENLTATDYSGHVLVKDKYTDEEFFLFRFPQGIDAKNQRIDYKWEIKSQANNRIPTTDNRQPTISLILYPARAWQLEKAVYPITIYAPVNTIGWNEIGLHVGQICQEARCRKDGDIDAVRPAGWHWGGAERKSLLVKADKIKERERNELTTQTDDPPEEPIPGTGETKILDKYKNIPYEVAGLARYGVEYTKLANPKEIRVIRDKKKKEFSPMLDARGKKGVIKKKVKEQLLTSVIPKDRVFVYNPYHKSVLAKLLEKLLKPVQAQTIVTSSIGAAARGGYTDIQTWENAVDNDLTVSNEVQIGILYNDSLYTISTTIVFDGGTYDATRYINLTVAPSDRHRGIAGTGVQLQCAAGLQNEGVRLRDNYARFEWVDMTNCIDPVGSTTRTIEISCTPTTCSNTAVLIQNVIVHDFSGAAGEHAISGSTTLNTNDDFIVRNSIIYDGGDCGIQTGSANDTATVQNNTVYGMVDGEDTSCQGIGERGGNGSMTAENNISMNNIQPDFENVTTQNNNLSEDTTANCGSCLSSQSTSGQFVSLTSGSEDFHLVSTSTAIEKGKDLSANFSSDIDDTARFFGTAWDIGADEFPQQITDVLMRHGKYFGGSPLSEQPFRF